jgi:protein SCO1/2
MSKKCPNCLLISVAAIIALAAGFLISKSQNERIADIGELQEQLVSATVFPRGFREVPEFKLQSASGETMTRKSLLDHWTLTFFGYTNCPDVCPMTLSVLKATMPEILDNAETADTEVLFVSVDGARDTPERLAEYVAYFDPTFNAATAETAEIDALTRSIGIIYQKVDNPNSSEDYLVDHSAGILVIDPAGEMRAVLSAPHTADNIRADYLAIRGFFNN